MEGQSNGSNTGAKHTRSSSDVKIFKLGVQIRIAIDASALSCDRLSLAPQSVLLFPKIKMSSKTPEKIIVSHTQPVEIVDWLSQGASCSLQIGETNVVVRFIGRKGRRARIAVSAMQNDARESDAETGKDKTSERR